MPEAYFSNLFYFILRFLQWPNCQIWSQCLQKCHNTTKTN